MSTVVTGFVPAGGEAWRNVSEMYRDLRDNDPVHHVQDGDYWVLSRFDDIFDAARDTSTFSSAQGLTFNYGEREKAGLDADAAPIVMMDPPEHTKFRRLISRGFTPRAVNEIEGDVRQFVRDRLGPLVQRGSGDIVAELFKPLPSFVVAHYLGVPPEDRDAFDGWTDAIVAANAGGEETAVGAAVSDLLVYFADLIERRRADPTDDMISALIKAEQDGADVSVIQILGFAFTMVTGGNDTTTGLLGVSAEHLTRRADQRRLLVENPDLITNAVEEFLRLSSPAQGLARMTTSDVELRGRVIPKDRKVMLLYGSANLDEREFGPDAHECDVTRKIDKILTFSYGAHHCIGAAVARLMARVTLEELLAAAPNFEVDYEAGEFAPGPFVRRYASLPFAAN